MRHYTESEIAYIKANKGKVPTRDIAEKLGVTRKQIENICYKLRGKGIDIPKKDRNPKKVSKQDVKPLTVKDFSNYTYVRKDSRTWVAVRA